MRSRALRATARQASRRLSSLAAQHRAKAATPKQCPTLRRRAVCAVVRSELRLGKPQGAKVNSHYVYILESVDGEHFYVGLTEDLRSRLCKHNAGEVPHTSKFKPWRIKVAIAFCDRQRAAAFER